MLLLENCASSKQMFISGKSQGGYSGTFILIILGVPISNSSKNFLIVKPRGKGPDFEKCGHLWYRKDINFAGLFFLSS